MIRIGDCLFVELHARKRRCYRKNAVPYYTEKASAAFEVVGELALHGEDRALSRFLCALDCSILEGHAQACDVQSHGRGDLELHAVLKAARDQDHFRERHAGLEGEISSAQSTRAYGISEGGSNIDSRHDQLITCLR